MRSAPTSLCCLFPDVCPSAHASSPCLAWDRAETKRLLSEYGIPASEEEAADLHEQFQGNPQLLLLTISWFKQGQDVTDIHKPWDSERIGRYLLLEVHENLSERERAVMRAIAALMGYPAPRAIIEEMVE